MNFFDARTRMAVAVVAALACGSWAVSLPQSSATSRSQAGTRVQSAVVQADSAPGSLTSRVRGTFGQAGTVRGTFRPARFFVRNGEAYAFGVLTATAHRGDGTLVGTATKKVSIPVKTARSSLASADVTARATCDILHLVLGPLDLDLLGLQIHLNRVVLDIVAVTGAGNLLGNLLCAVTGLLDNTGLLGQLRLANLLNRILSILRLG